MNEKKISSSSKSTGMNTVTADKNDLPQNLTIKAQTVIIQEIMKKDGLIAETAAIKKAVIDDNSGQNEKKIELLSCIEALEAMTAHKDGTTPVTRTDDIIPLRALTNNECDIGIKQMNEIAALQKEAGFQINDPSSLLETKELFNISKQLKKMY